MLKCPLCRTENISDYVQFKGKFYGQFVTRDYHRCLDCELIFIHPKHYLPLEQERQRYLSHENNIPWDRDYINNGYYNFLLHLWTYLKPELEVLKFSGRALQGLDYGSGPNPEMSHLVERCGYTVQNYDPIFCNVGTVLEQKYDFVLCNEVVEHFQSPYFDWSKLSSLLKPNGLLAVQTQFYPLTKDKFFHWNYIKDDTHVSFYNHRCFTYIEKKMNFKIVKIDNRSLVVFQKKDNKYEV